jgi:hypothetical protein
VGEGRVYQPRRDLTISRSLKSLALSSKMVERLREICACTKISKRKIKKSIVSSPEVHWRLEQGWLALSHGTQRMRESQSPWEREGLINPDEIYQSPGVWNRWNYRPRWWRDSRRFVLARKFLKGKSKNLKCPHPKSIGGWSKVDLPSPTGQNGCWSYNPRGRGEGLSTPTRSNNLPESEIVGVIVQDGGETPGDLGWHENF